LIAAIAFTLVPESCDLSHIEYALWLLAGAAVFVVANRIVEAKYGGKKAAGPSPLRIIVGTVVDGVQNP
jgi:ZIP family zinc transporter